MSRFLSTVKNERGYLLFEVIFAVAILSLGLVILLRCFAAPLKAVRVSQDHLTAALFAEQKIEELQSRYRAYSGAENGTFPGYSGKFKWRIETSRHLSAAGDIGRLAEVKLTVFWRDGDRERSISLTSLMMKE